MNWRPLDLAKMDSEKLREIVLRPEESAKLDFKIQLSVDLKVLRCLRRAQPSLKNGSI
ncbi:MAG: hypothetical protein KME55_39420 [Nostoc indistinguendum CM1-VF10]|jgi:hypothetical protein|nr:hypothetical protein [Nostoc indistinguendum CM1-VF10]